MKVELLYDELYYGRVTATILDGGGVYKHKSIFTKEQASKWNGCEMAFIAEHLAKGFRAVNAARKRDLESK